ncbi:hypothetical protein TUM17386_37870 [Shewanella algae]|nr:hypothetical protein TUM17386_37870 [Shewanella algae]
MLHKYYVFGSFAVIVFDACVNIYALKLTGVKSGTALLYGGLWFLCVIFSGFVFMAKLWLRLF